MAASGCNSDYPVDEDDWDAYFDCVQAAKDVARLYCGLTGIPNPLPKGKLPPPLPIWIR
jgi:hypothetical protein